MRHSLHSHIMYLSNKVQSLKDRMTRSYVSADEIEDLKAQIFHAELALDHYRRAYELELGISSPEPPDNSETSSDSGNGTPQKPKSGDKKRGRSSIAVRAKIRVRRLPGSAAYGESAGFRIR